MLLVGLAGVAGVAVRAFLPLFPLVPHAALEVPIPEPAHRTPAVGLQLLVSLAREAGPPLTNWVGNINLVKKCPRRLRTGSDGPLKVSKRYLMVLVL